MAGKNSLLEDPYTDSSGFDVEKGLTRSLVFGLGRVRQDYSDSAFNYRSQEGLRASCAVT